MVSAVVGSLVRRGLEMGHAHLQGDPEQKYQLPTWAAILMGLTILFFVILSSMVEYTFGRLIPTLLMVESPEAILFEPLTTEDPDAPVNKHTDPEILVVEQKPITSSFRTTIRHLQSKGGFRARYRGISVFVVWVFLVQCVSKMIGIFVPFLLAPVVAEVLCAQLALTWTHIVISDPNPKPWFRRVPSIKTWKKVAGPAAVLSVAKQVAVALPAYLAATSEFIGNPDDIAKATPAQRWIMASKGFSVFAVSVVLAFLLVIPANVILTRVQASLLPDEVESIVPFDRSFGGKVIPEIVGGSGAIGVLDAWKSFDWNARVRLLKTYAKYFAMQLAIVTLFSITLVVQVVLIVGKDLKKIVPGDGKDGNSAVFN